MDSKKIITDKAHDLFFLQGIRSVTMNEIALRIGMSKKTIYKFFGNKEILVMAIIEKRVEENTVTVNNLKNKQQDAVMKLFFILSHIRSMYAKVTSPIIHDLEKYYSSSYAILLRHRNEFIYQVIDQVIAEGIMQRLFRDDFHTHRMSRFFLESVAIVSDIKIFPDTEMESKDLANEIFGLLLNGIATTDGSELIEHYKKQRELFMLVTPQHHIFWNA